MFVLFGGEVVDCAVRVVGIIGFSPAFQCCFELFKADPFLEPDKILFHCAEDAFGVGAALGIVKAGEDLFHAEHTACGHKFARGGLAAVVGNKVQFCISLADAAGELGIQCPLQCHKPVVGFGLRRELPADDFLAAPVFDKVQVKPAPRLHGDFCHVDTPQLIGSLGARL